MIRRLGENPFADDAKKVRPTLTAFGELGRGLKPECFPPAAAPVRSKFRGRTVPSMGTSFLVTRRGWVPELFSLS
ncbi:MAG: hypothetical protein QF732_10445, partial [Nitrospinaceae bacterium]|nr:hypothetical protein [Nitrospinaceae bacterium]